MPQDPLIVHPQVAKLRGEIAILRTDLAAQLAELHLLEHTVKPNLLALYHTELGPWEKRLLETQCQAARLKRKAELLQASLNRGEKPDLVAIETTLELEFQAWQEEIHATAQKIAAAQFRLGSLTSPAETAQLKQLYYELVKQLHPDVNPHLTPAQRELWHQVAAAYEAGDLPKLQALALTAGSGNTDALSNSLTELQAEHTRLKAALQQLLQHLAELQQQPPFSLERLLTNNGWLAEQRRALETQITAAEAQTASLENHLSALLIIHGPGKQFGHN